MRAIGLIGVIAVIGLVGCAHVPEPIVRPPVGDAGGWVVTFDTEKPLGTEDPKTTDDYLRWTKQAIQERLDVDMHFPLNPANDECDDADTGKHNKLTFLEQAGAPASEADAIILYGFLVDGKCELHFIDEDDHEVQLTSGGEIVPATILDQDTYELDANLGVLTTWTDLPLAVSFLEEDPEKPVLVMFHATVNCSDAGDIQFRIYMNDDTPLARIGLTANAGSDYQPISFHYLWEPIIPDALEFKVQYYRSSGTWTLEGDPFPAVLTGILYKR